ncbi:hypothetical protein BABINDRAFT_10719 [Babjeviella inositovora NRRL Y-12698]|uniref:TLC domain-containing protein n=1 Tax=Babjeviella inositovora NRRL Y-12698 TaxID=984486 RepID=A0A1E3QXI6_9ASCO|nr:uncharacterized protein BABINDRAFT_10719 [Babjeviella inositovora NRRL Y-12698]ODQ82254.1 hypothetical protein BABINDRAFT_10719 [Babjeviella inositovora NRRL Y-12698]
MAIVDDPLASLRLPLVDLLLTPLCGGVLKNHIHEVVLAFLIYHGIYLIARVVSPKVAKGYTSLKYKDQIDYCIHVVSMIQCVVIFTLMTPLFNHPDLSKDRVFGYVPYGGLVLSFALGYFIWDALISLAYVKYFGPGFLIHGVISSLVFGVAFQPMIVYYCPIFLLFEVSTPFLNLRWFGNKIPGLVSDNFKMINNIILIILFFFVRISYGLFQAFKLFTDFYHARNDERFIWQFAMVIVVGNLGLNLLNFFWFSKMLKIAVITIRQMINKETKTDLLIDNDNDNGGAPITGYRTNLPSQPAKRGKARSS